MIAVYLQELPHRIGDYAVFVNAGMTPFQVRKTHTWPIRISRKPDLMIF